MNQSVRLAFCSMAAALSEAVMVLTGLIPVGTYAMPALAGVLLIAVVAEAGARWALSVYVVVSLLSVFFAADKEAVLFFVLFFGYYPVLKAALERHLHGKALQAAAKLAVFNAAAILEFWAAARFLGVPAESYSLFGHSLPWLFLLAGNLVFLVYDYAVSLLVVAYFGRLHKLVARWLHLK